MEEAISSLGQHRRGKEFFLEGLTRSALSCVRGGGVLLLDRRPITLSSGEGTGV